MTNDTGSLIISDEVFYKLKYTLIFKEEFLFLRIIIEKKRNVMKIIVFCATGGADQHVLHQALKKDFEVTAFVFTPSKVS